MLICLILEGSFLGAHEGRSILNQLSLFTVWKIGGIIPIPAINLYFFNGLVRVLLWDYSFYQGGYEFLRWTWMIILSPGAVWGIGSFFKDVLAQFVRVF